MRPRPEFGQNRTKYGIFQLKSPTTEIKIKKSGAGYICSQHPIFSCVSGYFHLVRVGSNSGRFLRFSGVPNSDPNKKSCVPWTFHIGYSGIVLLRLIEFALSFPDYILFGVQPLKAAFSFPKILPGNVHLLSLI